MTDTNTSNKTPNTSAASSPALTLEEVLEQDLQDSVSLSPSYPELVARFRSWIIFSGLGQALAQLEIDETAEAKKLLQDLGNWSTRGKKFSGMPLLEALIRRDSSFHESVTRECLAYLTQLEVALATRLQSSRVVLDKNIKVRRHG